MSKKRFTPPVVLLPNNNGTCDFICRVVSWNWMTSLHKVGDSVSPSGLSTSCSKWCGSYASLNHMIHHHKARLSALENKRSKWSVAWSWMIQICGKSRNTNKKSDLMPTIYYVSSIYSLLIMKISRAGISSVFKVNIN